MKFKEKLEKLTLGRRAEISEKAGLPASAISNYLSKNQIPRADKAVKIAQAVDVPVDWLFSDEKEWPAPPKPTSIQDADDGMLMREVCRRYRREAIRIRALIQRATNIDWREVAAYLLDYRPDVNFESGPFGGQIEIAHQLFSAQSGLRRYDPSIAAGAFWAELPGGDLPRGEFEIESLEKSLLKLFEEKGCGAIALYLFTSRGWQMHDRQHEIEMEAKRKLREAFASIEPRMNAPAAPKSSQKKSPRRKRPS
jgi:transcriptional regulator with XRE-family HTH domain